MTCPPGRLLRCIILGLLAGCGGGSDDAQTLAPATPSPTPVQSLVTGLDFPGSDAVTTTMRFRFRSPLAIYPATYIWRAFPRQQAGFYTAFFWANDDDQGNLSTFLWTPNDTADTYYGAHPYPRNQDSTGIEHDWEISIEQNDPVNGAVVKGQWYTQVFVAWADGAGRKNHIFYWNWPNTDAAHRVEYTTPASYGNVPPPFPTLTWGDAPWAPGEEVWSGILRGFQIYDAALSEVDIAAEIANPGSTRAPWYLNLNPTPADIADKSGNGHDPQWVGDERPSLWSQ